MRYDVIRNFQLFFSHSTFRIFYVKMATSEGGVYISLVETEPSLGVQLYEQETIFFISDSNNRLAKYEI